MKKLLLWVLVLVMSVSLIMVFSSGGCRRAAPPVEESVVEEPVVEEVTGEPEEEAATEEEEVTEEAVVQIPEGWKQFTGSGFELYLPEKWEGGSKEELDSVVEKLKDTGQNQLASQIEAGLSYLLFFAYDTETLASEFVSNLNIAIESDVYASLEEYMDIGYEAMAKMYEESGYSFNIIEQDIVPLGNNEEVGRTIIDQTALGVKSRMVQYIIKPASDVWVISCGAGLDDFESNIQTFDKIAETFKILE